MKLFLCVQKIARHRVTKQSAPILLETGNFLATQLDRVLLLFLESLALCDEVFVLAARLGIAHESIDPLADRLHTGLVQDGLAKLSGFLHYC